MTEIEQLRVRVAELEEFRRNAVEVTNCYANEALLYQNRIAAQAEQIKTAREAFESIQNYSKDTCLYSVRHLGRTASRALAKLSPTDSPV